MASDGDRADRATGRITVHRSAGGPRAGWPWSAAEVGLSRVPRTLANRSLAHLPARGTFGSIRGFRVGDRPSSSGKPVLSRNPKQTQMSFVPLATLRHRLRMAVQGPVRPRQGDHGDRGVAGGPSGSCTGSGFGSSADTAASRLRTRILADTGRSARTAFITTRSGAASTVTEARNSLSFSDSSTADSPPFGACSDRPSFSQSRESANWLADPSCSNGFPSRVS